MLDFKKKRIRSLFLFLGKKSDSGEDIEQTEDYLLTHGMEYIQMRLPIEKITSEFEENLKKQIEQSIIRAKIREAKKEDLSSVMEIYNKSWMTSNEPFSPMRIESLEKIFKMPDIKILIATAYGIDAGFVILDFEGENNQYGVIAGLGILPRFQRRGMGKVLGMAAWNYFKQYGISELRCEVHVQNNVSYKFIKSLGFEEFGKKTYKKEDFRLQDN